VKLIIVERLAKAAVLSVAAISFLVAGRLGILSAAGRELQEELGLGAGRRFIAELIGRLLTTPHQTTLGLAVMAYALLEGTEGVGLWLRRRWAEYLTVLATGFLIPYEVLEVIRRTTLLRVGALLVNVAVVGYLAYRKRLFIDV